MKRNTVPVPEPVEGTQSRVEMMKTKPEKFFRNDLDIIAGKSIIERYYRLPEMGLSDAERFCRPASNIAETFWAKVPVKGGEIGKVVKLDCGRAAVIGDDRREYHCSEVCSEWEGAAEG